MLSNLISVLQVLSPGLAGVMAGGVVGLVCYACRPGMITVMAGSGGVLGYLLLAATIRMLDANGMQALSAGLLNTCLTLLIVLTAVTLIIVSRHQLSVTPVRSNAGHKPLSNCESRPLSDPASGSLVSYRFSVIFLTLLLAALVGQNLYQAIASPVSSWDALGLWTFWADRFADFHTTDEGAGGMTRTDYASFPFEHPRHPLTLVHLAAFSGYALQGIETIRGWLAPWSFVWLCAAAVVCGFVREVSGNWLLAILATYGFCALPLLENHAILVGYADPWIAAVITMMTAVAALGLCSNSWPLTLAAILFAVIPVALKNTGILYVAALVVPLLTVLVMNRWPKTLAILVAVSCLIVYWKVSLGFDVTFLGSRFAVVWGEPNDIVFGGYKMAFVPFPVGQILFNDLWAFLVNQSFALVALVGLLTAVLAFDQISTLPPDASQALKYLVLVTLMLLLIFLLPQVVTQYAERFAVPESDLGNSRFLLGIGPVVLLTTAFWNGGSFVK